MADDEKGSGAWSKVPTWDGDPKSWRSFQREMEWWLESLDVNATTKYNLAARWLLRQSGIVRQRGEEFTPSELAHQPEEKAINPETGDEYVVVQADPLKGMRKLLKALESINGKTVLDKRGDLRNSFYLELRRKPGERISEFCTRFRSAVADLRMEGVTLPSGELGWFLKQKLGLDAIRTQLLETALQGKESYEETEVEVLRLFRDLHVSDPLQRRAVEQQKNPVFRRFLSQQSGPPSRSSYAPSSAAASMSSGGSSRSFATSASRHSTYRKPFSNPPRQAHVTETEDDEVPEDEEEMIPENENGGNNLEEVLQAEAEILASEIEEALEDGIDASLVQDMEETVESAAEALVTMREARHKLAEVKKDRGYGKVSPTGTSTTSTKAKVDAKKSSGKYPCFDCGKVGHWAGDSSCSSPGAGIGRKSSRKPPKSVRVVETLNTEHVVDGPIDDGHDSNEVLTVTKVNPNMSMSEALEQSSTKREIYAVSTGLAQDKRLVGALDSACNRTVTGPQWLQTFLHALHDAPQDVRDLISKTDETETFKFGDGGTQVSHERWRLPMMIGDVLVCFNVSIVPVPSLGLLLGRDFLETLGATMDFSRKIIKFDFIGSAAIHLKQLTAGHYLLPLLPQAWKRVGPQRWRKFGIDGVVELQLSTRKWLDQKLGGRIPQGQQSTHEHYLTERSLKASLAVHNLVDVDGHNTDDVFPAVQAVVQETCMTCPAATSFTTPSSTTSLTSRSSARSCRECLTVTHGFSTQRQRSPQVAKTGAQNGRKIPLAPFWVALMACAASWSATSTVSVPSCRQPGPVAEASNYDGGEWHSASRGASKGLGCKELQCPKLPRRDPAEKPLRHQDELLGGPAARRHDGWEGRGGTCISSQARCHERGQGEGRLGAEEGPGRRRGEGDDWSPRRSSKPSPRFGATDSSCEGPHQREDDSASAKRCSSTNSRVVEGSAQNCINGKVISGGGSKTNHEAGSATTSHEVCSATRCSQVLDGATTEVSRNHAQAGRVGRAVSSGQPFRSISSRTPDVLHGQRCDDGASVRRWVDPGTYRRSDGKWLSGSSGWGVGHPTGGSERPSDGGHDRVRQHGEFGRLNDAEAFEIRQDLKRGQAKLIADAWNKHMADCKKVSAGFKDVREILEVEFEKEMQDLCACGGPYIFLESNLAHDEFEATTFESIFESFEITVELYVPKNDIVPENHKTLEETYVTCWHFGARAWFEHYSLDEEFDNCSLSAASERFMIDEKFGTCSPFGATSRCTSFILEEIFGITFGV